MLFNEVIREHLFVRKPRNLLRLDHQRWWHAD